MNVDKISVTNSFRGYKFVKNAMAIATASVAASGLYAESRRDGVDPSSVIDEYYKNEFELRNKSLKLGGLARFSPKEKLDILQNADEIKLFSKAFYRITNAKNEDNTPRFNADESLALFHDAAKDIEENPEFFKKILNEKDSNNKARFNSKDCALLMQNANTITSYPKAFDAILAHKDFEAAECLELILQNGESLELNPESLELAAAILKLDKKQPDAKNLSLQLNKFF